MNRRNIKLFIIGVIALVIAGMVCLGGAYIQEKVAMQQQEEKLQKEKEEKQAKEAALKAQEAAKQEDESENIEEKQKSTYTFLQGPKSYEQGIDWSGQWCQANVNGASFGSFGCGLCAMADIYDTLSPYEVSPLRMCKYARKVSGYSPSYLSGAIGWGDMKTVLKKTGMDVEVKKKPDSFEKFCKKLKKSSATIALISSADDDSFWQDTPGHYVVIWYYDEEDKTVFLSDPGQPKNNRKRIKAKYVYKALKSSSKFQLLYVWGYDEDQNKWKGNGIKDKWNRPDYLKEKSE